MPQTEPALGSAVDPVWTLKVNCSGSWANVVRFPSGAQSLVMAACWMLNNASCGHSKFKVVDESCAVVAEVPLPRKGRAP